MKRLALQRWIPFRLAALIAPLLAAWPQHSRAAGGDWVPTAGGGWGTAANWNPVAVPGNTAGDVVNINTNIAAAASITLDANRTVGTLLIGDTDGSHGFALTGNTLILDQTGVAPALVRFGQAGVATATATNSIASAIQLNDAARFYSQLTANQTLSGTISGAFAVVYDNDDGTTLAGPGAGQGTFLISNTAANTYSGGTTIDDVRVQIQGNNAALGTGAVNILDGGQVFNNTGLTTIANTFNVAGNGWLEGTSQFGALRLDSGAIVTGGVVMTANAGLGSNSGTGTINGIVSGAFQMNKRGGGILVLGGANTYSGGTDVTAGALQANNNAALGTGAVTISGVTARLQINGGVTIANNVTVNAGVTGVSTTGLLHQVGTGQARVNGIVTLNSAPTAGGTFFAATNTVGNELVLGGAVNSTANLGATQRDGRVIFVGGGNATGIFTTTGTTMAGATNGIPQGWSMSLGGSASATLDLNGFDQALAGLALGNAAANSAFTGSVILGSRTLTLNADLSTLNTGTGIASHTITGTAGGGINFGATPRTLLVNDSAATDDLTVTGATLNASGGLTKTGPGTLSLNGATVSSPLTVSTGTLRAGTFNQPGSFTANNLTMSGGTTLTVKTGTGGDLINSQNFVNSGTTNLIVEQIGGMLANGNYPVINYTGGTSPGTGGFNLAPFAHATASLVDTGSAIAVNVTANDRVIWDGTASTAWATGATGNWKLQSSPSTATDYFTGDDVIFQDAPVNNTVNITANVTPSNITFTNTVATTYTLTGTAGIVGTTGLTKSGDGQTILRIPASYTGPTAVQGGSLEVDFDGGSLTGTSGVNVATGATLKLTRDGTATNTTTTFSRNLTGTGNLDVNLRTATGTTAADSLSMSGNNNGFSAPVRLLSPASGTFRWNATAPSQMTSGSIEVQNGAQLLVSGGGIFSNPITITGTGYADSSGNLGALRIDGSTYSGNVTVAGTARIGSHNSTGTITGNISGGNLEMQVSNFNNSYTTNLTGTNTFGTLTIGGGNTQTAGVPTMRVGIGNGGTTGTLGTGNVTVHGDGANGVLAFDRSDGYTLAAGQTITGSNGAGTIANSIQRTFVDLDSTGAGFSDNASTITLGTAALGGSIRVGQGRAGAIVNISGTLTAENVRVSTGATGGVLNIQNGATINSNTLYAGEAVNMSGTINQAAGSNVSVAGQVRLGHFGTETSTYNMNGGSLTLTGASPTLTPSTAAAGGASATGDNNINGGATASIHGGGIYLGIDGTGIFNHNAGTVSTNWMVLDNRAASGAGANMPDGIDRYNISGSSLLKLKSTYGLIGRNEGSYAVSLGGGTIQVDNTGTGTGTGANINVALDATLDAVPSTTTTLDTNGAGNSFTLTKNVRGTGTIALAGGGNINLTTTGVQNIAATLTGSNPLTKAGAGLSVLSGNVSGYTGNISVNAGVLAVPAGLGAGNIAVGDGAAIAGEPAAVNTLTLGGAVGSGIYFDPSTPGALTTNSLVVNGTNIIDFMSGPGGTGPYTVINYGSKSGAGTFAVANPTNYRVAPVIDAATGNQVTINLTGRKDLTWTGAASTAWNINGALNWNDTTPAAEKFYTADGLTFPEGAANTSIALTGLLAPSSITVNAATTPYTFTSTTGNQIVGATGINKSGNGTLTLTGPNAYNGPTNIGGGTVVINGATSLGSGTFTNTIGLSGGGTLSYGGTTAIDFGPNRSVTVGSGGGVVNYSGTTASIGTTVSGNLSGSGPLTFRSTGTGTATTHTYTISGNNAGYTGAITVEATGNILSQLAIPNAASVPNASSITLNYPAAGATQNATTLSLGGGVVMPAATTLNFTSSQATSAISLRTGMALNGAVTINSPITVSGTAIVQFNGAAGSVTTYNGNITETTPGAYVESGTNPFSNVVFLRGTGTHIVNGQVNLPSAGSTFSVTDGATAIINSTGNVFRSSAAVFGTIRLGANDALPAAARLVIGQGGDQAATLDLNGFNQTVAGMEWQAVNGNLLTKGISNTHPTATSTFTVNQATAPVATTFNGTISGRVNFVKEGAATVTLGAAASNFTGNVAVNAGTLTAASAGAANGSATTLGQSNLAGRTVTVGGTGTLNFTSNNIFGNGVGNNNLPKVVINSGGTLSSTRYNVLGDLELNGGTVTQAASDSGNFQGYQFRGSVTAGGSSPSQILTTNGKGNHLGANTQINVADVTGSSAADLTIGTPLVNQSGDFGLAAGGFTKTGPGTLALTGISTYTGATFVNGGTLRLDAGSSIASSSLVTVNPGGTLGGSGIVGAVSIAGGTLAPGASPGILNTGSATSSITSSVAIEIGGLNPGTEFDIINTTGSVTINDSILAVSLINSYIPNLNDSFDVWINDGADLITGTFAGLPEGAMLDIPSTSGGPGNGLDSDHWLVSYTGGTGNDLRLTYIPEPSSALLAAGAGLLVLNRRRRLRTRE